MRRVLPALALVLSACASQAPTPALTSSTRFLLTPGVANPAYSEAVEVRSAGVSTLYLASLVPEPVDRSVPVTSPASLGDMRTQTDAILKRVKAILNRHGYDMRDVVKVSVFVVADPATGRVDNEGFAQAYAAHFGGWRVAPAAGPHRVTVAGLTNPLARVALDVIAVKSN
jgi:enamine deaminase RidA (YjgF/YER057c/UK114 family)